MWNLLTFTVITLDFAFFSGVSIVNFEYILHIAFAFQLFTLNKCGPARLISKSRKFGHVYTLQLSGEGIYHTPKTWHVMGYWPPSKSKPPLVLKFLTSPPPSPPQSSNFLLPPPTVSSYFCIFHTWLLPTSTSSHFWSYYNWLNNVIIDF